MPDYAGWKYAAVLDRCVAEAETDVIAFSRPPQRGSAGGDPTARMRFNSTFACTGCHQR